MNPSVLGAMALAAFSQHAPLLFLLVAAPATLREKGAPLSVVGLFALVFIPFALQFLWAPAIERMRLRHRISGGRLGAWRTWLVATQIGVASVLAVLGFIPLTIQAAPFLIAVSILLAALAGTQKIALGGFAVEHSPDPGTRAVGTAAMGAGAALGSVAGTIGLVTLFAASGWSMTIWVSALGLLLLCPVYLIAPRQAGAVETEPASAAPSLKRLMKSPDFGPRLGRIISIGLPLGLAFGLVQPRLIDAGLDLAHVGLVNGLSQLAMWVLVAPLMALCVRRFGTRSTLRLAIAASAAAFSALGLLTLITGDSVLLAVASACSALSALIALSTSAYTVFMRRAEIEGQPATDFSVYLSLYGLAIIAAAGGSGFLGQWIGYGPVLIVAGALGAAGLWLNQGE